MNGANPVKTSNLVQDDGAIKPVIEQLEELIAKYEQLIKLQQNEAVKLERTTRKTTGATVQQTQAVFDQAEAAERLVTRYRQQSAVLQAARKELTELRIERAENNKLAKLEAQLARASEGSYDALSAQYRINKIQLNALSEEMRSNTKEGRELEKQTADIFARMKELQAQTGKTSLNVGNYTDAIGGASKAQRRLVAELADLEAEFENYQNTVGQTEELTAAYEMKITDLTEQIDNLGVITGKTSSNFGGLADTLLESEGAAGDAARGIKGLSDTFRVLLRNPILLTLTAIVGVLGTLFSAFTRSEKGASLLATATGVVNGILSQLTSLAVSVATTIEDAFTDPKGAIEDLGNFLIDQVINRFEGIINLGAAVGRTLKAAFTLDVDGLKQAGEDAARALAQIITGLDTEDQDALTNSIRETVTEVNNEIRAFAALEQQKRSIRRTNRALIRSIEDLTTAEELNNAIADDTTKSFQEREEAAENARQALEDRANQEVQLARNNLSLLNDEINLRRSNGEEIESLLDQQLAAYRELRAAERGLLLATRDNERTRSELQQDRLERDLDILIDGFDNQKTINERIIADDQRTFSEREKLLQETQALADASFARQIETIQQFTGVQVNANDLIAESDAVVLNEKIRALGLSEIIEGRVLEIVRERRIVTQDLAEAEKELTDEIAQAAIKRTQNAERQRAQERAAELKAFDEQAALKRSEFDLEESTETQKTQFRLQAEAARLRKIIEINERLGGELNDTVIQTYRNQIKAIENELATTTQGADEEGQGGLLSALGLNFSDEELSALKSATDFIKQQLLEVFSVQKRLADQAVSNADRRVSSAEATLQAELTAANNGAAAQVETARRALEEEKRLQEEALEAQRQADKEQRAIQTGQQTFNLITAASKILSELPIFAAIPAIALMFGSFAAAKIRAGRLARETFGDGGFEYLNYGGKHGSGNDIYAGQTRSGKARMVERGEGMAIFSAKAMQARGARIEAISNLLNKGGFDDVFIEREKIAADGIAMAGGVTPQYAADNSRMESSLSTIAKNTARKDAVDHRGRRVVRRGFDKTTYIE